MPAPAKAARLAAIPGLALLYLPVSHLVWWSEVEGVIELAGRIVRLADSIITTPLPPGS